jgi:hypothetical protein
MEGKPVVEGEPAEKESKFNRLWVAPVHFPLD